MNRRLIQARFKSDQLIIDNIPLTPLAAFPRLKKSPTPLPRIEAQSLGVQLVAADRDRSRELGAGRFGQNPQAGVECLIVPRWRPEIICGMDRYALLAGRGQVRR